VRIDGKLPLSLNFKHGKLAFSDTSFWLFLVSCLSLRFNETGVKTVHFEHC